MPRIHPRIEIFGTKTGKVRARVTPVDAPRFEVTIGGHQWLNDYVVSSEVRVRILERARHYVNRLDTQVVEAIEQVEGVL